MSTPESPHQEQCERALDRFVRRGQAAQAAADEAIGRAKRGAGEEWMQAALDAIETVAGLRDELTTDDVWAEMPPWARELAEGRAMGAAMRGGRKWGWIEPTATYRPSERVACHGRPLRVWRSLLRRGA